MITTRLHPPEPSSSLKRRCAQDPPEFVSFFFFIFFGNIIPIYQTEQHKEGLIFNTFGSEARWRFSEWNWLSGTTNLHREAQG